MSETYKFYDRNKAWEFCKNFLAENPMTLIEWQDQVPWHWLTGSRRTELMPEWVAVELKIVTLR